MRSALFHGHPTVVGAGLAVAPEVSLSRYQTLALLKGTEGGVVRERACGCEAEDGGGDDGGELHGEGFEEELMKI